MRRSLALVMTALAVAGCERGGTTTEEARAAAIEKARQELGLSSDVPLEATLWVGLEEYEDQPVICGTVSGQGSGTRIQPQRFAGVGEPVRWLVFEDAHDALLSSQPDKFVEWQRVCSKDR